MDILYKETLGEKWQIHFFSKNQRRVLPRGARYATIPSTKEN